MTGAPVAFRSQHRKGDPFGQAVAPPASAGARLDRLPIVGFHRRVLVLISLGGIVDSFDIYLAFGVAAAMQAETFASSAQTAAMLSCTFFGMLIGAGMGGVIGDRFGRRCSYQFNLVLFGGGSLAAAVAPTIDVIILCRFLMGLGLGAELIVASGTLGEFIPPRWRGRWASIMGMITSGGLLLATGLGYLVIPRLGWRAMFAIGGAGALVVLLLRKQLPESPRWLESAGRHHDADRILRRIEAEAEAEKGRLAPPAVGGPSAARPAPLRQLFSTELRGRLAAAVCTAVAVNACVYGLVAWLPVFMVAQGASVGKSLAATTLMSSGTIVGSALGAVLSDRISRRAALIGAAAAILAIGFGYAVAHDRAALIALGFLLTSSIYFLSNQGMYSFIPEIFPTACRLRGVGMAGLCARAVAVAIPFAASAVFHRFGLLGVVAALSPVLLAMVWSVARIQIDARGKSLEDVAPAAAEPPRPRAAQAGGPTPAGERTRSRMHWAGRDGL